MFSICLQAKKKKKKKRYPDDHGKNWRWSLYYIKPQSVQFSHSVMSDSLWPHGLQHTRPPCPSPTPWACSNSCPSSRWCHPTISSFVVPFSSCLQSFPASGSFPVSQFFTSGDQSIGASASASVLPMNIQDWFPLGLTRLILNHKDWSKFCSPFFERIQASQSQWLWESVYMVAAEGWENSTWCFSWEMLHANQTRLLRAEKRWKC